MQWRIVKEIYDRDPVHEPSWRVKPLDGGRRVPMHWRTFQSQYSLAAKRNAQASKESLSVTEGRKGYFASRRD